jgi:valyl-tRNA synthetase
VIDEHGADALRFTLVAAAPTGTDIHLAPEDFRIGRNFANKLWNAARYVLMNVPADFEPVELDGVALDPPDKWILHRLDAATEAVDRALASFRMNDAAQAIYEFLWHDYCDWYIEWSKPRLATPAGDAVRGVLLIALERSLRLLHPFMPFVTEELWRQLPAALRDGESVMTASWPEPGGWSYPAESASMQLLQQVIGAARALRARYDVPPTRRAPMTIAAEDPADRATLERFVDDVARLALASEARVVDSAPRGEGIAGEVVRGGVEIAVRLADLVDVERERDRLGAEIAGVDRLLASSRAKLADERFVSRAPAEVVAREREKAADLERSLERLRELESSLEAS